MKLLKIISLCLVLIAFSACDTFYRAYLINDTDKAVTVISNVEIQTGNSTILKFLKESNNQFTHELIPNSEYVLAYDIDLAITAESFPCDTLIIVNGNKELRLNSKEEILAAMNVISDERMELRITD